MNWLSIAGDAFQILTLAFIGATTRQLSWKIDKDVALPLPWAMKARRSRRLPRNGAFAVMVGVPIFVALALSAGGRLVAQDSYMPLIFFGLKTASAGLFAIIHLTWMRGILRTLLVEGVLKP